MRRAAHTRILLGLGLLLTVYVAYPYVTLYRLAGAIRRGDAASLESLVDWEGVREGIKEDICDTVLPPTEQADGTATGGPGTAADGTGLPEFGASFVKGIAESVIDREVTAAGLVGASRSHPVEPSDTAPVALSQASAEPRIRWAFFDGPASFSVELLPPPDFGVREPIRIQMQLKGGAWKVSRAWLPASMLVQANSRT
jgi:hypothetical protein